MKTVIFLGPSMPLANARGILDATYCPPAQQADIMSAVDIYQPDAIALIDGCFHHSLSVWHKEILYALQRGVRVFGGASLGAIRAAETQRYGMVGIGRIFEMFRDGILNDDDEVAVSHGEAPEGFRPLSLAMVSIRETLKLAAEREVASVESIDLVVEAAKELYFADRTFPLIFRRAKGEGLSPKDAAVLYRFMEAEFVDLKRTDAESVLRHLRSVGEDRSSSRTPPCQLERSLLFETLYRRERTVHRNGAKFRLENIAQQAALHLSDFDDLNFSAANFALTGMMADMLKVEVSPEDIAVEARRFRLKRHILTGDAFEEWLREHHLRATEFDDLMRQVARARRLQRWLSMRDEFSGNTQIILDWLRLHDRFVEAADYAAAVPPVNAGGDADDPPLREATLQHLRATRCQMPLPYELWVEEAGFDSLSEYQVALKQARLARNSRKVFFDRNSAENTVASGSGTAASNPSEPNR